ncbi:hypothetical protein [Billgrantia saliphila]|uniref:hypothetical protein n=1 Tax=Billgrantia saliphila TaxID=1848458 RepID=UPI000CE510DB|nr:hypothetical protein [Halomonas saliphila]
MQPLSYYYYNVLEGLEKPCDVPSAQLQEGYDILYRHGGRIEIDLMRKTEDSNAQGMPYHWYEALDEEQRAKLHKALNDEDPAKILKIIQRNGYAGVLYHHAWHNFRESGAA